MAADSVVDVDPQATVAEGEQQGDLSTVAVLDRVGDQLGDDKCGVVRKAGQALFDQMIPRQPAHLCDPQHVNVHGGLTWPALSDLKGATQ
jgi:hypothetical protein